MALKYLILIRRNKKKHNSELKNVKKLKNLMKRLYGDKNFSYHVVIWTNLML